jgi:hypothetical protein
MVDLFTGAHPETAVSVFGLSAVSFLPAIALAKAGQRSEKNNE